MTSANATKLPVRAPYTFESLRVDLLRQHDALDANGKKTSWHKIAKKYGVTHAAVHRIAVYGREPKDQKIRSALGLPPLPVTVIPCLHCGGVHLAKRCPTRSTPRKYAPRPVVRWSRLRAMLTPAEYEDLRERADKGAKKK